MRDDLHAILKPDYVKRYQGRPAAEIAEAPLEALRSATADWVAERGREGITSLGQLARLRNEGRIRIDPLIFDTLVCLLFYPKHDPGPDCAWERLFEDAPLAYYAAFPGNPFHTRFGPVFYRGRLDGTARVLVIGQDPSTDEI